MYIVEHLVFHLLIKDVQFTEDSDEDWEPESDPEIESTKHRLDTRSVHAIDVFITLTHGYVCEDRKITLYRHTVDDHIVTVLHGNIINILNVERNIFQCFSKWY